MNKLDGLLMKWKSINESFLIYKKEKKELELQILSELREKHWNDYNHAGVHASILTKVNEYVDLTELPLLLSKSDIEKIVRRNTVKKLVVISDDMRKAYNKKIRGDK